jgi:Fe-S-cluster containining protein
MADGKDTPRALRFACTQCGACCNRSPEVLLSEAPPLADIFVFRLMFRLYALPRTFAHSAAGGSAEAFYESKRLLAAFAARNAPAKKEHGTKSAGRMTYLTISALPLDTRPGACSALERGRCGIYERRPLACRTVPFHYSRAEAAAETDLATFVARAGYACDTGAEAPVVLAEGRIVDPGTRAARREALEVSTRDRRWQDAIVRRLRTGGDGLPSLAEIEANAAFGMTTVSMAAAWRVAAEAGVIGAGECGTLIGAQAGLIKRALAAGDCAADTRRTLIEMGGEYSQLLSD